MHWAWRGCGVEVHHVKSFEKLEDLVSIFLDYDLPKLVASCANRTGTWYHNCRALIAKQHLCSVQSCPHGNEAFEIVTALVLGFLVDPAD
jgi:hypothetical protein